ncbi:Uncharacterised BCR, YhbC family COG0779 [Mycoplasmopsis maculosa]|uniref:Uncharacterized BCR, YhbC family COG0779 n=1 Tax=Mycoplasmopsis maculosa TaxID=114885 RepID=A0A449B4L4_9BACT|nr:ribosome assembly cofactor RimP [Mycoplasmopsis maculosa]VEU75532.1 Uncharacterised BCR, YhbC family COG0779 [Mycoplasmopsis maculosa]
MNWKDFLQTKFNEIIKEAKIINEDNMSFLDITVSYTDLNEVDKISKEINEYIDQSNLTLDFDYLTIHSPGFKTNYEINELGEHIDELIDLDLKKSVNKLNHYTGKLLSVNEDSIVIHWNNKGQFRKIELEKNNIIKINKHIKF